jgi:hypothetical protein
VVDRLRINLNKVFSPCELIKEVFDSGNRVLVFYCDFIRGLVINVDFPGSIFLLYHHDWTPAR